MMNHYNTDDFSYDDLIQNDFGGALDLENLDNYSFEEEDDSYLTEIDRLLASDGILDLMEYLDEDEIAAIAERME